MDTAQFFLLHHERLYGQLRELFGGLTDEQMRLRPHPRVTPIAWLFWHMASCEDALSRLLAGRALVLDDGDFLARLNLPHRNSGVGMSDEQVDLVSARVELGALRAYQAAVGRRTEELVSGLRAGELGDVPDSRHLDSLFGDNGVFGGEAGAVRRIFHGRSKGWFLGHLGLTHPREHLGQAILVKKMQGLGSGRT